MTDTPLPALEQPRRFHFHWLPPMLLRPRQAFDRITSQNRGVWLTPLILLSLTSIIRLVAAGYVRQQAALTGQVILPPDFQYYTPEQQAQFMQAMQAQSSSVFLYVLPILGGLLSIWFGWLLVSGLLHLLLTMFGGRGDTGVTLNVVAWASLPFVIRDIIRALAIISTQKLIKNPGISGFSPTDGADLSLYLVQLLSLIDLYFIWHMVLLFLGAKAATHLANTKGLAAVLLTLLAVIGVQALLGFAGVKLGTLTVNRPFFF
jgi:hypothetical protein